MTSTTFAAMGTTVNIHATDERAIEGSRATFERFEQQFSRFRSSSELSRINRAAGRSTSVSDTMQRVLLTAAELRNRTGGLVDIGVGAAVHDWGYSTTFSDMVDLDDRPRSDMAFHWRLDGQVVHLNRGTRLDLGGIVKGWTCDRLVEAGHVTVASAGGDVRSSDPSLVVEILDDHDAVAAEVQIGVGALATSSRCKREWKVGGESAHHIIDPRTRRPAVTPVLSASVVAKTAVEAEAGAKAVLIRGVDGLRWADSQPWIRQAIVVWHDGSVFGNARKRAS